MIAFFLLLFVLIVVYFFMSEDETKEGFEAVPPSHTVNIPATPVPNATTKSTGGDVIPHTMPGQLPVASYQQIAAMSPLPYQDTTLIKANRQQLLSLLESLKGFLAFEAQEISEKSDPSIQLPLATARSDFDILQSEVQVINRNPGIQSTITLTNYNEIASNLAYLQKQVRLTGSAGALQGPVYEFTKPVEGFVDTVSNQGQHASVADLTSLIGRIQGEILRLSASGTNDPIITARVAALTYMKASIQTIVDKVKKKTMKESEIPIRKADIDKALPILGKPSEPLPQLVKAMKLPAGLANALPSNVHKDPDTMREISKLVDKYGEQIINGVSASFSVQYTPPHKLGVNEEKVHAEHSMITKTGFPSMADLNNVSNGKFTPSDSGAPVTDHLAPKPSDAGRGPSHFDWEERAKQIEDQVRKRGLNPTDFGIMAKGVKLSKEFSWKGYARMICTRLQATMDPGLPETCGCPPMDWSGWRIAK